MRGQVRRRLLESARTLCARDGVGATSLRGVVRSAGTNLNSVHYHYGSREALIDAVADDALEALNRARFLAFDELEPGGGRGREDVSRILAAGYGPLFHQALGPERDATRPGLLVVGQLRNDPLGPELPGMNRHAERFIARIEAELRRATGLTPGRLRPRMQLVNAAAWDSALRPDVLARVEAARSPRAALARLERDFLAFSTAGLCDLLETR